MKAYKALKIFESIPLFFFNLYAGFKYYALPKKHRVISKNNKLRKTAKEKKCYILMGGLSVKEIDLDMLIGSDVITANNFFRTKDYLKVKPKYHVITDEFFYKDKKNINELELEIKEFTSLVLNGKHMVPVDRERWYYIYPAFRVYNSKLKVDLSRPCSNFSTVTLSCIQLAIYLGYKEINLVGFDLPPGHMPHYYQDSAVEKEGFVEYQKKISEYEYCELFWQYTNCHHEAYKIDEYARANGISIVNTSKESYVRAFPYKKFEAT